MIENNYCIGNSQAENNAYDGIFIDDYSHYNNIRRNMVWWGAYDYPTNQQRYGINIASATCWSNQIVNNRLDKSGVSGGLNDLGTNTVVENNML